RRRAHDRAAEAAQSVRRHGRRLPRRGGESRRNHRQRDLSQGAAGESAGGADRPSFGNDPGGDRDAEGKRRAYSFEGRARAHGQTFDGRQRLSARTLSPVQSQFGYFPAPPSASSTSFITGFIASH